MGNGVYGMTWKKPQRGYFGIGAYAMKDQLNYGTLFRTASVFGASFIFLIGKRFKQQPSDTVKSQKHIPLYEYENFNQFLENRPYDCKLIGVENNRGAKPIKDFKHPERALYLCGPEDTGLPNNVIDKCDSTVVLPGDICLNLAVAGSIVLFDRINKGV